MVEIERVGLGLLEEVDDLAVLVRAFVESIRGNAGRFRRDARRLPCTEYERRFGGRGVPERDLDPAVGFLQHLRGVVAGDDLVPVRQHDRIALDAEWPIEHERIALEVVALRVLVGLVDEHTALATVRWDRAGERHARALPGFDAGNSPTELAALDLRGRILIHTTHAGTQGLVNATCASEVLTGAFVNLSAVAGYIRVRSPEQVSLVRMGHEGRERCVEDDLYARCLLDLLEGRDPGLERVPALLREAPAARKFFDPACEYAPEGDFAVCADVDRYGFVLRLRRATGAPAELERVDPPWIAAA